MTAWFSRRRVNGWRLIAGALFGTVALFPLLFSSLSFLFTLGGKICLSILMIMIVFGFLGGLRRFIVQLMLFYMVAFLFGGGILGIGFLLQGRETILNGLLREEGVYLFPQTTWITLGFGYGVMFFLSKAFYQVIRFYKRQAVNRHRIRLSLSGREIELTGLYDTGNQLYEPITRIPVMIVEVDAISALLPAEMIEWVKEGEGDGLEMSRLDRVPEPWRYLIRFIPYRVVGNDRRLLLTLVPDWIEVVEGGRIYRTGRLRVGLTKSRLSAEGAYQALLHPDLLKEEYLQKDMREDSHVDTFTS